MTEVKQPIINVRGLKVALGPYLFEHYETFLAFIEDPEVSIFGSNTFDVRSPISDAEEFKKNVKDAALFTIFELENLSMIGQASLRGIDHRNGTATFGISIGRKEFWGKGYGTEATKLVLDYGFRFLNLSNIKLRTGGFNNRGQVLIQRPDLRKWGVGGLQYYSTANATMKFTWIAWLTNLCHPCLAGQFHFN